QLADELTVNHVHFLNGYRICGVQSNRLNDQSDVTTSPAFVRLSRCAYSPDIEKYSESPRIGRSFLATLSRGVPPRTPELVVALNHSVRSYVPLMEYVPRAPTTFPP